MTDFTSLGLSEALLRAIDEQGYKTPTPIQQQAIEPILAGKDVLASAQTGTGKTAHLHYRYWKNSLHQQRKRKGVSQLKRLF